MSQPPQVVTGEAVALDLRPALLPSRLVAGGIDALAQALLLLVLLLLAVATGNATSGAGRAAIGVVVVLGVLAGYPIAFESLWRGRTPGKAALGLRVVRDDGGPIGFRQALVRGLSAAFVERPGVTFFVAGMVSILLNSRGKRLGDLLAGTVVLQERVAGRSGQAALLPPQLAGWAAELDLHGLTDDLALAVRSFLARAPELTDTARHELGGRLAAAVAARVTPPPPPGTAAGAYLSAVLAERRLRSEQALTRSGQALGPGAPAPGPVGVPAPSLDRPASGGGFLPPE